jgi:MOSC domain-containing protein YiiM
MSAEAISILSVNVGMPRVLAVIHGKEILSGIAKEPVYGPVFVGHLGIDGDGQADLEVHGGVDKAIYAYPSEHWEWWMTQHRLVCAPNTFGENLALRGADETDVAIGDRFRWGEVLLEICQPRAPCFKLALHTQRDDVPGQMTLSARCGWYLRVIEEGQAPVQDAMLSRVTVSGGPNVRETFLAALHPRIARDTLLRIHDAPALSEAWRRMIAKKIAVLPRGI